MIKFVREYVFYGQKLFDVIHTKDGDISKAFLYVPESNLPKTVKNFLKTAISTRQYDITCKCEEIIYTQSKRKDGT